MHAALMPSLQPLLAWVSPPSPAHRAMRPQQGRWGQALVLSSSRPSAGLLCSPPLQRKPEPVWVQEDQQEASGQRGVSGPPPLPHPAWPSHSCVQNRKCQATHRSQPVARKSDTAAPWQVGSCPALPAQQTTRKGQPEAWAQPLNPKHTQGSCTPILVSPKAATVGDPQWARRLHRCPTNSPGSLTPAGPPRATHPALLGPRSHLSTLSTSLTLATQELPGFSGLICKMGQAPSPPQGTPRKALAAQRAFHWEGLGQFPGAWTSSVAEARERQRAGSHGPFRSPPKRMGGAPAWGSPGQARLGGLVLLCRPSLHPAQMVGPAWARALVPSTYKHPGGRHGAGGGELTGPWGPRRPASWWILL